MLGEAIQSAAPLLENSKTAKAEKRIAELIPQYEAALTSMLEKKKEIDARSADLNRAWHVANGCEIRSNDRWDELIEEFHPEFDGVEWAKLFKFSQEIGHARGLLLGLSSEDKVNETTLGAFFRQTLKDPVFIDIVSKWIAHTERKYFGAEESFDPFAGANGIEEIRARLEYFSERHTARLRQEVSRAIPAHLNVFREAYIERLGIQQAQSLLRVLQDRRYAEVQELGKPVGKLSTEIYALSEQLPPTSEERARVGDLLKEVRDRVRLYDEPAKQQGQ